MSRLAVQLARLGFDKLGPLLAPPEQWPDTARAASRLAAMPLIAFECRLGEGGGPIDLSQRFRAEESGPRRLAAFADQLSAGATPGARNTVPFRSLATWWESNPDSLDTLWLEMDSGGALCPSIFLAFFGEQVDVGSIRRVLDRLSPGSTCAFSSLEKAIRLASGRNIVVVNTIGLMLSRSGAVRGTFRGSSDSLRSMLAECGWTGSTELLDAVLGLDVPPSCRPQIVLDFAPDILPSCGVEFVFMIGRDNHAEIASLLDTFVAKGWADRSRGDAVLTWRDWLSPAACPAGWPDALMVQRLRGQTPSQARLARHIGHLKLNLLPGAAPVAKAYLSLYQRAA